jgi:hypothetical protein
MFSAWALIRRDDGVVSFLQRLATIRSREFGVACLVASFVTTLTASSAAYCQTASTLDEQMFAFSVPAGPLVDVLEAIGQQSGLQIVYDYTLIAGASSRQLTGTLLLADALRWVLADTTLEWDLINSNTIALRAPRSRQPSPATRVDGAP